MRVGFDIDGVLADFLERFYAITRELCGAPADNAIQTGWDLQCVGVPLEVENEAWARVRNTKNWWLTLRRLPGTYDLKEFFDNKDNEIYFITSRVPSAGLSTQKQAALWLANKFNIQNPAVLVVDNAIQKACCVKGLELEAFIDDRDKNVQIISEVLPNTYLMNATYNQQYETKMRVKSADEYLQRIRNKK